MLRETRRNPGNLSRGAEMEPREDQPPTLGEVGLDKKTSKLAKYIARLPAQLNKSARKREPRSYRGPLSIKGGRGMNNPAA